MLDEILFHDYVNQNTFYRNGLCFMSVSIAYYILKTLNEKWFSKVKTEIFNKLTYRICFSFDKNVSAIFHVINKN